MIDRREFSLAALASRGMPEDRLEKIFGTNLYRLYADVLG